MKKAIFSLLLMAASVIGASAQGSATTAQNPQDVDVLYAKNLLAVGTEAPAFPALKKGTWTVLDFWATWCGGCRQIIKEYEPLKKDISEDKVAFIYLTGPSSIKKTWEILIEDIAGEHYWLDKEQWEYLWTHFQMTGLPMYLLIDKQGNIVKRFTHITAKELKDLLEQEINKI